MNNMPKANLKVVAGIVATVLLISLGIGAIFFIKPKIATDQVSTDSGNTSSISKSWGLQSKEQKISFNQNQELYINSQYKGTSKEFILKIEDLKEGKNTIEFKGVQEYGPITTLSKNIKTLEIITDKTPPQAEITSEIPKFFLLEKDLKLKVKTEVGAKIFIDEKEIVTAENEDSEITVPIVDGKNDLKITTKDNFGNVSNVLNIQFEALLKDGWEKYKCKDLNLAINTNRVQRGYNGVVGVAEIPGDVQKDLDLTNSGYCSTPREGFNFYYLFISPKNTKIPCLGCDDFPLSYLFFYCEPEIDNVKKSNTGLIKSEDFSTKSGISGKLNFYSFPEEKTMTGTNSASESVGFVFSKNGFVYAVSKNKEITTRLNTPNYYQNLDADFEDLINNLVFED